MSVTLQVCRGSPCSLVEKRGGMNSVEYDYEV